MMTNKLTDTMEIIVAARGGLCAKSRCADILSGIERQQLVCVMLEDVLASIQQSRHACRVHVVSPTHDICNLATRWGTNVICEESEAGLNAAFVMALNQIKARRPDAPVLLMPGDLPLLEPQELDKVIASYAADSIVLVPSTGDGGTGAIALRASQNLRLSFGSRSFAKHLSNARELGLKVRSIQARSIGLDVDDADDLLTVQHHAKPSRTADFLSTILLKDTCG